MQPGRAPILDRAIIAVPGSLPITAAGASLAVHEWTDPGPSYLHVHHVDDEAWHVLDGVLRFRFSDRVKDVAAGTTVFVPAGVAHTYEVVGTARYLIFLTPRLDRLIAKLRSLTDPAGLQATLAEFDTSIVG